MAQFTGKPIKITLEPKSLVVLQLPGKAGGRSPIILYNGNRKYSSIEIHWSIVE